MPGSRDVRAGGAFVEIFSTDTQLVKGLSATNAKIKAWSEGLRRFSLAGIGLGAGAIAGLVAITNQAVETGSRLDDLSQRLGLSANYLSKLEYVAKLSGTELEVLAKGEVKLRNILADVNNLSKEQTATFKMLGLDAKKLAAIPMEERFLLVADALSKITDETQLTATVMELFGKSGVELIPIFRNGAKSVREMIEEGQRLGIFKTDAQVAAAAKLGDTFDQMKLAASNLVFTVGVQMIPVFEGLTSTIINCTGQLQNFVNENEDFVPSVMKIVVAGTAAFASLYALSTGVSLVSSTVGMAGGVVGGGLNLISGGFNLLYGSGTRTIGMLHYLLPAFRLLSPIGQSGASSLLLLARGMNTTARGGMALFQVLASGKTYLKIFEYSLGYGYIALDKFRTGLGIGMAALRKFTLITTLAIRSMSSLSAAISMAPLVISSLASSAMALPAVIGSIISGISVLGPSLLAMTPVIAIVAAIAAAIILLSDVSFEDFNSGLKMVTDTLAYLKGYAVGVFNYIVSGVTKELSRIWTIASDAFGEISTVFGDTWDTMFAYLQNGDMGAAADTLFTGLQFAVSRGLRAVWDIWSPWRKLILESWNSLAGAIEQRFADAINGAQGMLASSQNSIANLLLVGNADAQETLKEDYERAEKARQNEIKRASEERSKRSNDYAQGIGQSSENTISALRKSEDEAFAKLEKLKSEAPQKESSDAEKKKDEIQSVMDDAESEDKKKKTKKIAERAAFEGLQANSSAGIQTLAKFLHGTGNHSNIPQKQLDAAQQGNVKLDQILESIRENDNEQKFQTGVV
jgi:hypothetical protein